MKKVIGGKIYDTDKATLVAEWDNGYYGNDFKRCEEALYRTKEGTWFVVGEGGPMSKYARAVGNMTGGGEGLTPLTDEEAMGWLEDKGETDALEEYFADRLEEA